MQLRDQLSGNRITLDTAAPLGRGGEAQVYPVLGMPDMVAKIYAPGKATPARARKLAVMLANPPEAPQSSDAHVPLAWPHSLLTRPDDANAVVGFLMPRAHADAQVIDYYNPQRRLELCPLFDYRYLLRTARNLAAATRSVHARGYVIGDLKHSNVLVSQTALVTLVDTDSFQVRDPQSGLLYPCQVGTPDYTPPERQNDLAPATPLTPEHDLFALGVLIFQLLMEGTHPFAGVYTGEGDPPPFEERIAAGHFPYGANSGPYRPGTRVAPSCEMLPPKLQSLFLRCFEAGHADPSARPDAQTWQSALDAVCKTLVPCPDNPHHFYSDHLPYCPWCERRDTQLRGRDPFPAAAPRTEPSPQVIPAVIMPPRIQVPSPVSGTVSRTPHPGNGLVLGWVGLAGAFVFGLSLMAAQFHHTVYGGTVHTFDRARRETLTNEATPTPIPDVVVHSHDGQYTATYNDQYHKITITNAHYRSIGGWFEVTPNMFQSMTFSKDDRTIIVTYKNHLTSSWILAGLLHQ